MVKNFFGIVKLDFGKYVNHIQLVNFLRENS